MSRVGTFQGWPRCAPRLWGLALLAAACSSESDDGFDRVISPPGGDGGAMDGSVAADAGPPPAPRPDPFIEQPDDGADAGASAGELPPYDVVGTRWEYAGTTTSDAFPTPETSTRVQRVTETFTWPDGRAGARHETEFQVGGETMQGPITSFAIEDDRIVLEEVGGMMDPSLPAVEIVAPLVVGTRFGPRAEAAQARVTAQEEITVPAGTYQAWKLEAVEPLRATRSTEWWAEGVGLVRAESVSPGPMEDTPITTVIELEAFETP